MTWLTLLLGVVLVYVSVMYFAHHGGPVWLRRLRIRLFGCPICGRRRMHLRFCRYATFGR